MKCKLHLGRFAFVCLMVFALVFSLFQSTSVVQANDGIGLDSSGGTSTEQPVNALGVLAQVIQPQGVEVVPDHYIVVYKEGYSVADSVNSNKMSIAANGGSVTFIYGTALNGFAAYLPEKALTAVLADPKVDYVEADGIVKVSDIGNDPNSSAQSDLDNGDSTNSPVSQSLSEQDVTTQTIQQSAPWGLDRIDQHVLPRNGTYGYAFTGSGVNVYIINSGIRSSHTDFGGRATKDYDAIGDGQNGNDCNGAGTAVAGVIGGAKYGVAKAAKLHAIRVLGCDGSGTYSQVIAGMNWVAAHAVKPAVANFAIYTSSSASIDTAVNNLINKGITTVVAAGDSNDNACYYSPARVANALTVGATSSTDSRSSYSDYGSCVDLFAPGSTIPTDWYSSIYATAIGTGTAMATAHATGVAALYLQNHKTATVTTVVNTIKSNATAGLITNPGSGSPNKLLYALVNNEYFDTAILVSPRGTLYDWGPTFKWSKVSNATQYILRVYRGSTNVIATTLTNTACSTYYCNYNVPSTLLGGNYTWQVRAYIGGWRPYSPLASFYLNTNGFDSPFTVNAAGWTPITGTWPLAYGWYNSMGINSLWASTAHTGLFPTGQYSVTMKRLSNAYNSSGLLIRGTPSILTGENEWANGYLFVYSNNGLFSYWLIIDGIEYNLVPWQNSPYINPYDWNTLSVKFSGTSYELFINNNLVAYGDDSSFTTGQVGIAMYGSGISSERLSVDSASLTTNFTMSEAVDRTGAVAFNKRLARSDESPFKAP